MRGVEISNTSVVATRCEPGRLAVRARADAAFTTLQAEPRQGRNLCRKNLLKNSRAPEGRHRREDMPLLWSWQNVCDRLATKMPRLRRCCGSRWHRVRPRPHILSDFIFRQAAALSTISMLSAATANASQTVAGRVELSAMFSSAFRASSSSLCSSSFRYSAKQRSASESERTLRNSRKAASNCCRVTAQRFSSG